MNTFVDDMTVILYAPHLSLCYNTQSSDHVRQISGSSDYDGNHSTLPVTLQQLYQYVCVDNLRPKDDQQEHSMLSMPLFA